MARQLLKGDGRRPLARWPVARWPGARARGRQRVSGAVGCTGPARRCGMHLPQVTEPDEKDSRAWTQHLRSASSCRCSTRSSTWRRPWSRSWPSATPARSQIVLAVGPGHDDTLGVARRLAASGIRGSPSSRTRRAARPRRSTSPSAAASHDIIVRVDGHGFLSTGYIERAVRDARGDRRGQRRRRHARRGRDRLRGAVARRDDLAARRRGRPVPHRRRAGPADTVYLGVFRREWLEPAGGYDPRFTRAQDWELNYRIRQAGGVVWFDPALTVKYRPRPTLRALARQYRDYGRWRRVVATRHKGSINARYLAPPDGAGGGGGRPRRWPVLAAAAGPSRPRTRPASASGASPSPARGPPRSRCGFRRCSRRCTLRWGWGFLTSRPGDQLVPGRGGRRGRRRRMSAWRPAWQVWERRSS